MKIRLKIFLLIFVTSLVIFALTIAYIINDYRTYSLEDARKQVSTNTSHAADLIKTSLEKDLSVCYTISKSFKGYDKIPPVLRDSIYNNMLRHLSESSPEYMSAWMSWELKFLDKNYFLDYGRSRVATLKQMGVVSFYIDTVDLQGDNLDGLYYKSKQSKLDILTNPYYFTYQKISTTDSILVTSIATPIVINDEFAGLVGLDVSIDRFWSLIKNIKPFDDGEVYLLSSDARIISSTLFDKNRLDTITKVYSELENYNVVDKLKRGQSFSLSFKDSTETTFYASFASIFVGNSPNPWSVCLVTPTTVINRGALSYLADSFIIGLIGILILSVFSYIVASRMSVPIKRATSILTSLSSGIIDKSKQLHVQDKSKDELSEMNNSINTLMNTLQVTADFAKEIGDGNFSSTYQPLSKRDVLGNALLEMQHNLQVSKEQEEARILERQKLNWSQEGLTELSEVLRKGNTDFEEYMLSILSYILKFIKSEQGAIFLLNTMDKEHPFLELSSAFAYDKRKSLEAHIEIGESIVGRCFQEQEVIYMTNIPEGYTFVSSGLGDHQPRCLFLMPLIFEKEAFGVVEIASFRLYEDYEIDFLKVVGERIASSISVMKKNFETRKLLESFQVKSSELENMEAILNANKEELAIAKETASDKERENLGFINAISHFATITWLDMDGKVLKVIDKSFATANYAEKDIIQHKTSYLSDLKKQQGDKFKALWANVQKGNLSNMESSYILNNKRISVSEIFMPIKDSEGVFSTVINISIDLLKR